MFFMHFMIVLMTILIIVIMTTTLSRILYRFRWKLRYMYYVAKNKYKGEENHIIDLGGQMSFHFDAFISYIDEDRDYVISLVNSFKSIKKTTLLTAEKLLIVMIKSISFFVYYMFKHS